MIFVHLLNDFSGSPRVLKDVITSCLNPSTNSRLYLGSNNGGFLDGLNIEKHNLYYEKRKNRYLQLLNFLFSQFILFFKLILNKKNYSSKTIYINTLLPFAAAIYGRLSRKRVIYHIHEVSISPIILKKFLIFIASKCATEIIFVSNFVKNETPIKNIPSKVIYNSYSPIKTSTPKWESGKFNVLMICSLKNYKGIPEFLKIAQLLNHYSDISFSLLINASKEEIEIYFKSYTIPPNVTYYSKDIETFKYYQNAQLVINLSDSKQWIETFGLTLIEAMFHGLPVIAPPIGGPLEIVTHGFNGFLIDSKKTQDIAGAIISLSQDRNLYIELSKNALLTSKKFSHNQFKEQIKTILEGPL